MGEPITSERTLAASVDVPRVGNGVWDEDGGSSGVRPADPRLAYLVLGASLLPFAVSAIALAVVGLEGSYFPSADHAMTEARVSDVAEHPPLIGLYSRADWAHPGPLMFYLLAPFYWLTGGSSVGPHLGALAINGAAVAGMILIARRRGGPGLMVCTALGCALLMRTLGAEFLQDPWNNYLPVVPYGLLIFLTWSMACGETWALPIAVGVTSFLAQTHVGFVALGVPLLLWGAAWLVVSALRSPESAERRRRLTRMGLISVGIAAVAWLPPLVDAASSTPSNISSAWTWFREADDGTHTLAEGVRVVTAQFGLVPEWLTTKQPFGTFGQSSFLDAAPVPWLLLPVAFAAAVLWRSRTVEDGTAANRDRRHVVAIVALTLGLGAVAVMRTVGPAFDYRLRWTWVPPMVGLVMTLWASWLVVVRTSAGRAAARWLVPASIAGLALLGGVNSFTAALSSTPYEADSEVVEVLTPQVVAALPDDDGAVIVREPYRQAAWYARGLVLELERRGFDARVDPGLALHFGEHRVYDDGPVAAELVVVQDDAIEQGLDDPTLRRIAEWRSHRIDEWEESQTLLAELSEQAEAGRISDEEFWNAFHEVTPDVGTKAGAVAVFVRQGGGVSERPAA